MAVLTFTVMTEPRRHTHWLAIVLVTTALVVGSLVGTEALSRHGIGVGGGTVHAVGYNVGHDAGIVVTSGRTAVQYVSGSASVLAHDAALRGVSHEAICRREPGRLRLKAIVTPMRT